MSLFAGTHFLQQPASPRSKSRLAQIFASFARNLELVRVWVGRRQWREELSAGGRRRRPQMRAKFTSNVNNNNISPHQMASLIPDLSLSRQLAGCHQVGQTFLHPWQGMWIIHSRTLCYFEVTSTSVSKKWDMIGSEIEQMTNGFPSKQTVLYEGSRQLRFFSLVDKIFPEKVSKYL